jgi:ABC-type nitrate/sulfonate/bicarbonate transport system ATPase subunit
MISVESLTYSHAPAKGEPLIAIFENFNWRVERGEAWVILGPSGCGKTTLLYLLAGLRFPTSGQVAIDGQPIERPRPLTGLILQDYGLLPWQTVKQNVELGLELRDFYGPDGKHAPDERIDPATVDTWLERLGLASLKNKYPQQISGGQRQRTAIARTLALQPDLLLMDEPFASLDAPTRQALQDLTLELWREQRLTLVVVTHTIEEAAILGGKILLLHQPPNREATVIVNPGAGESGFRDTPAYLDLCRDLRLRMEMV